MKPRLFELARLMALKSDSRFQLGCVVARNGRPISLGCNDMRRTHSKSPSEYKSVHAEFDAIRRLTQEQTEGAIIYLYRETKDGKLADSKPCSACEGMIRMAGIKRVFYTSAEAGYQQMRVN